MAQGKAKGKRLQGRGRHERLLEWGIGGARNAGEEEAQGGEGEGSVVRFLGIGNGELRKLPYWWYGVGMRASFGVPWSPPHPPVPSFPARFCEKGPFALDAQHCL